MAGGFIGFDASGVTPITSAINRYITAVKSIDFSVSQASLRDYARGKKSLEGISKMLNQADAKIDNLVTDKLEPFKTRIKNLNKTYTSYDSTLGTKISDAGKNKFGNSTSKKKKS